MSKKIEYKTRGTCSRMINLEIDNGTIVDCSFVGGCAGNTQGIAALVKGMKVDEAIKRMKGIKCGFKPTSCPDQLAAALETCLEDNT